MSEQAPSCSPDSGTNGASNVYFYKIVLLSDLYRRGHVIVPDSETNEWLYIVMTVCERMSDTIMYIMLCVCIEGWTMKKADEKWSESAEVWIYRRM